MDDDLDEKMKKEMDIMSMLKRNKLSLIKRDFEKREKGLNIDEFVKVMLEHLDYAQIYERDILSK